MQASKNFKSNKLLMVSEDQIVFRRILWDTWTNGDERIPDNCEELFVHVFRRKRSCNVAGTMDSRNTWKYYKASCNNKINWGWQYERQVYVVIQRGLSVIWNCNGEGHKGFGETSESIFEIFWSNKRSSGLKGLSKRKWVREPNVKLSKMFNPNRREIRVPEYRRGIKDPNTTQWQRGP